MVKKIIVIISIVLAGCQPVSQKVYRDTFIAAGTFVSVVSPSAEASGLVRDEFTRLEKLFDPYREGSDIYRINRSAPEPVTVDLETIELMKLAVSVYELTGGYFDISKGNLYELWKERIAERDEDFFSNPEAIAAARDSGTMKDIRINLEQGTVALAHGGMSIDPGGIAKGFMVDKAVRRLREAGIESAIINAGGDLYCLGKDQDTLWKVGVKDPREPEKIIFPVALEDESIATSGDYEQFFEYCGQRYSHIVDPFSGYPVKTDIVSVSVIAHNVTTADSFATAFFAMGLDKTREFFSKEPTTLKAYVVAEDKKGRHIYEFR